MANDDTQQRSSNFWRNLPVAVQAIVALLGAVGAFITVLVAAGFFEKDEPETEAVSEPAIAETSNLPFESSVDKADEPAAHETNAGLAQDDPVSSAQNVFEAQPRQASSPAQIVIRNDYPHRALLAHAKFVEMAILNAPNHTAAEVTTIKRGTEFAAGDVSGDWVAVRTPDDQTGWMLKRHITIVESD